jgi:hypothetical protein
MTKNPTTLASLKFQDWVIDLKPTDTPQSAAEYILNELFPDDRPVYVRELFVEGGTRVWESYKDSGSDDYVYIKQAL